MVSIGNDSSCWKLVIADNVSNPFGICVVTHSQWPSHLLPEILDLNLLESSLHEFVYLGQDGLLPIFEQLILFYLRRL